MAARKKQTYGDLARSLEATQKRMVAEKERMAAVMAKELMNGETMVYLGDCSDADLRRVMALLSGHVKEYVAQVQAEKQAKKQSRQQAV